MANRPILEGDLEEDPNKVGLEILREIRDNTRKNALDRNRLITLVSDLEDAQRLSRGVAEQNEQTRVLQEAIRKFHGGYDAFGSAARWLERLRPRITRWRVSATLLALLVAYCGGLVTGHWFLDPALWPTSYSTEALCIKADGFWVPLKDGGRGCLFAN